MTRNARFLPSATLLAACLFLAPSAQAQLTLYGNDGYGGAAQSLEWAVPDLDRSGRIRRASSAMVRGERWEVCEERDYRGRCQVLREGRYPSLEAMGLYEPIRSVRRLGADRDVDEQRYAPLPAVVYDERRRRGERLYEARVSSVRAVMGTPQQRCWIERGEIERERGGANVPGGIAGALIGGIIGHQIGGGHGRDLATVGGVVAGAAIGANIQRDREGRQIVTHDVRRCAAAPDSATPEYWDVVYVFRGVEHRIQTRVAPGETVTVNRQGEPRA